MLGLGLSLIARISQGIQKAIASIYVTTDNFIYVTTDNFIYVTKGE